MSSARGHPQLKDANYGVQLSVFRAKSEGFKGLMSASLKGKMGKELNLFATQTRLTP